MQYILAHWSEALGWIITLLAMLFGGGSIVLLLPRLKEITEPMFTWLAAHAEIKGHELANAVTQRVISYVRAKVLEYENTIIEDLKVRAADGKLTGDELIEEYKKLAEKFRQDMKELLTLSGLWGTFMKLVGGGTEAGAFKVLDTLKEAAVSQLMPSGLQTAMDVGAMKRPPTVPPPAAP